jgi:hypothetical protein
MASLLQPVRAAILLGRWRLRRRKGRSFCVQVADPARYLAELDDSGARNVVMRWYDEVPTPETAADFDGDVDVLVDDDAARAAAWRAAAMPGPVRVEFRSVTGRVGSFAGMPYLPPSFALDVLAARVRHPRGFPVPAPEHRLPLVLFHLCYHKAEASGLPSGVELPTAKAKKDYATKLRAFARSEGVELADPLTLTSIHEELVRRGWDMQLDLLARWPRRTPWIEHLEARERERYDRLAALLPEAIVFILRDDVPPALREHALSRLAQWFDVLEQGELDAAQRQRCRHHLRGGNWTGRRGVESAEPTWYVVCNDPRPAPVRNEKLRETQPHLTNARVRLKFTLREELREMTRNDPAKCRSGLHSSDNRHEAMHFLDVLFAERLEAKVREFAARVATTPRSSDAADSAVASL